jgi:death on curing protein
LAAAATVRTTVRFLTADQVVAMHDALIDEFGGLAGGGPRGESYEGVDAAVQAVRNSYYETAEELAAAYAVYLVQGHVFLDGNKRTGAAAMLTFLEANRVAVRLPPDELAWLMIDLQRRAERGEDPARLVSRLASVLVERAAKRKPR